MVAIAVVRQAVEDALLVGGRGGDGVVQLHAVDLDVDGLRVRRRAGAVRVKAETILTSAAPSSAVPVVVSTDSQLAPEKVAPSATHLQLRLQRGDFASGSWPCRAGRQRAATSLALISVDVSIALFMPV